MDVGSVMRLGSSNYLLFSLGDCFVCLFLNTLLKNEMDGETLLPMDPMGHNQSVISLLDWTPISPTFSREKWPFCQHHSSNDEHTIQAPLASICRRSRATRHASSMQINDPEAGKSRVETQDHTLVVAHGVYSEQCFPSTPNFQ